MNHNFKVECRPAGSVLSPDTMGIGEAAAVRVEVYGDGQHDGRLWPERDVRWQENELVDKIMQSLRTHVEDLVRKVKPFSIHGV